MREQTKFEKRLRRVRREQKRRARGVKLRSRLVDAWGNRYPPAAKRFLLKGWGA